MVEENWWKKRRRKRRGKGEEVEELAKKRKEKNEGMARLVVVGCDARLVDRSRTRGEIFIIPFKNLHRKIRLTYCAHVAIFSIERKGKDRGGKFSSRFYSLSLTQRMWLTLI